MKSSVKEISARRISLLIAFAVVFVAVGARGVGNRIGGPVGLSTFAGAPLYFEGNDGQFEGGAPFIARGAVCSVLIAPTEAEIVLGKSAGKIVARVNAAPGEIEARTVRLQLVDANPASKITGRDQMPARANYFIGNEPAKWHTGVLLFSKVQVDEVYPGVRVVYYANQSAQLEYDFLVQPGARPGQIRFRIEGADKVRVDEGGNLALQIGDEEIQEHKPVVYQENGGSRREIPASYHLNGDGTVGFELAEYDRSLPLVIDPVLDFLTYMGGKRMDIGWAIALDANTNVYVAGEALSMGLLTTNAIIYGNTNFGIFRGGDNSFGDAFVAKYDNSGALQFLTYLGGKTDDGALGIAFDSMNNAVWVTGFTDSTNFPLLNPIRAQLTGPNKNAKRVFATDAFIVKLDPSGTNLLFSTYFGGENLDEGVGIAVTNDSVYVVGITGSTNLTGLQPNAFQTIPGGDLDAFITRLTNTGPNTYTNAYTTYLGGTNTEYGLSIAVDSKLDAWVTGLTYSTNFYTTNALQLAAGVSAYFTNGYTFNNLNTQTNVQKRNGALHSDAFVTEMSPDGLSVPFSTFLGGSNDDVGEHIAIDGSDNVFVTGYTLSRDFPTNTITTTQTPDEINEYVFPNPGTNFFAHVFVTEISNQALAYSVHFGGNLADQGLGIAVDNNGLTYVTGSASSTNFYPTVLLVTNTETKIKHGITITNYFGIVTNSPVFTDLSSTNDTVKLKHGANTNDIFVVVLSPGFTNFNQQILLGGPGEDEANGIAVDPSGGTVYIVGSTTSKTNFATTNAAQEIYGGVKTGGKLSDAFIGKIQIVPSP
jgi:hypothetical protein